MEEKKEKQLYIEAIRIFAIIFVIYNHTNARGFTYFTTVDNCSFIYQLSLSLSIICGCSVPLFFMISGALLVDKDETLGVIFRKRILKYVIVLIVFSLFYYLFKCFSKATVFSISEFFKTIYSSPVIGPYWFLYVYISYLACLPFTRKIAKHITEKETIYLIVLVIVFEGIVPMCQYLFFHGTVEMTGQFSIYNISKTSVLYPVLGYRLANSEKWNRKKLLIMLPAFISAILLSIFMTNYRIKLTGETMESRVIVFFSLFRVVMVIYIFMALRTLFSKIQQKWADQNRNAFIKRIIFSVGSCTFGIYLIEERIREDYYNIYHAICKILPDYLSIWIYIFMVLIFSYFMIYLLKKVPILNRLFGF